MVVWSVVVLSRVAWSGSVVCCVVYVEKEGVASPGVPVAFGFVG